MTCPHKCMNGQVSAFGEVVPCLCTLRRSVAYAFGGVATPSLPDSDVQCRYSHGRFDRCSLREHHVGDHAIYAPGCPVTWLGKS